MGKSTFINDMINAFPMYKKADQSYRNVAKSNPAVVLNENGTTEAQKLIMEALRDEALKYKKDDNIIHDRGVYDNLSYSLWLNYKGKIDDLSIERFLPVVRNAGKSYDIIFFLPMTADYDISLVEDKDGQRSMDPEFRKEIDAIMKSIFKTYQLKKGSFFDFSDCPAVIPVYGTREERIQQVKFYLEPDTGQNIEESAIDV